MSIEPPAKPKRRTRKVVAIGDLQTPPAAPTAQAEAPAAPPTFDASVQVEPVRPSNRYLQLGFLSAVLFGISLAVVGSATAAPPWIGLAGPLLAIVGFYVFGKVQQFDASSDTRQQFADSCYFLGFLLTMIAMLVGFLPAGLFGQEITSQGILRHFSMALGATALGLVFRILVLQGGRPIDQLTAEIETDLVRYARTVSSEARAIGRELKVAREELSSHRSALHELVTDDLRRSMLEAFAPIQEASSEVASFLATQSSTIAQSAERVQAALGDSAALVTHAEEARTSAEEEVIATSKAIQASLSDFKSAIDALRGRLTEIGDRAGNEIAAMSEAFTLGTEAAPRLLNASNALAGSLARTEVNFTSLKATGEQLEGRFREDLDTNGRLLKGLEDAQRKLTQDLQQVGQTAVATIRDETAAVNASLLNGRETLERELGKHRAALEQRLRNVTASFEADLKTVENRLSGVLGELSAKLDQAASLKA